MSQCIRELTLNLGDDTEEGSVYKRLAARGIIRRNDKYLAIYGKYGDYKFPGGGREAGEELADTLIREVQEETGCRVIPETIGDHILVHERRKGNPEDWLEMDSWYYFCDVEEAMYERSLDDYEREYGYRVVWAALEEMIRKNETADVEKTPWSVREAMVMRELAGMEERDLFKSGR